MASAWETRFAEFVQRATALRESGALEVLHDLLPVMPVVEPSNPELSRLRGERNVRCSAISAAVAAQFSTVEVAPRAPNTLLVIDQIILPAGQSFRVNGTNDSGFTDVGEASKDEADSRYAGVGFPYAIGAFATAVAVNPEGGSINSGGSTLIVPVRYVMHPGFSLSVQCVTVNTGVTIGFAGYTRSVGADEIRSMS